MKKWALIVGLTGILVSFSSMDCVQAEEAKPQTDYETEVQEVKKEASALEVVVKRNSKSWLPAQKLANTYMYLAKLTGDYSWYKKTESILGIAKQKAPQGSGPLQSLAGLHYTMHRIDEAEKHNQVRANSILLSRKDRAEIASLEGDIAFHRQDYETARTKYDQAIELNETPQSLFKKAYFFWQTGDFKNAEAWTRKADAKVADRDQYMKAWMDLQLGLMDLDRDRLDEALAHYQEANTHFKGYWLIREHIAEIYSLQSKYDIAEKMYVELVEETQSPELMSALAEVYENTNRPELAKKLIKNSTRIYKRRLRQYKTASLGHAFDHFLSHGRPQTVMQLAQENYEVRPNAEASLMLAQAHLKLNQFKQAEDVIEKLLQTPYRSPALYEVAAETSLRNNKRTQAKNFLEKAQELRMN